MHGDEKAAKVSEFVPEESVENNPVMLTFHGDDDAVQLKKIGPGDAQLCWRLSNWARQRDQLCVTRVAAPGVEESHALIVEERGRMRSDDDG
jgi:hypothetical protein